MFIEVSATLISQFAAQNLMNSGIFSCRASAFQDIKKVAKRVRKLFGRII
ncbi:hypothetical protein NIES2104_07430 [Leptolyngbya sp. NIES-2104]|nr:hypothetical protein NIES2104_07430 [Leptolyngbya sp. NIES-2104]